jgi:hypothetical protein
LNLFSKLSYSSMEFRLFLFNVLDGRKLKPIRKKTKKGKMSDKE